MTNLQKRKRNALKNMIEQYRKKAIAELPATTEDIISKTEPGKKMFELAQRAYRLNRISDAIGRWTEIFLGTAAAAGAGGAAFSKHIRGSD